MCYLLAVSLIFIMCTLMASYNRGYNHRILRRLGVKDISFWLLNWVSITTPTIVSCVICATVWHYQGILPFSQVTLPFCFTVMTLVALISTSSASLIASVLGRNQTMLVIGTCFIVLVMVITPGIIHTTMFNGTSIFDPSIVPQWSIWVFMILFPPFLIVVLADSMTSTLPDSIRSVTTLDYKWKVGDSLTPIDYLY